MTPGDSSFDWFHALSERRNADGTYRYSREELEDFFSAILLTIGFDLSTLPEPLAAVLSAFVQRAGVEAGMTRRESKQRVAQYFLKKPLNREFSHEFQKNMRDMALANGSADPDDAARTFALFSGTAIDPKALIDKPAPEGSVRGGPLGFFAARKKLSE